LPLILLQNNVSSGQGTVSDTYRQYVYIYLPGIIGAVLGLLSIELPLVGRKWSLVFSAAMQGLSMAMYTQVRTTAGYVGLNALEYIMQTVSTFAFSTQTDTDQIRSTLTLSCMLPHQSCSTLYTEVPQVVCSHASVDWLVSSLPSLVRFIVSSPTRLVLTGMIGERYLANKSSGILWLGAGGIWLSALVMVFLPVEMKNRQMF
jgi:hypothetical protein